MAIVNVSTKSTHISHPIPDFFHSVAIRLFNFKGDKDLNLANLLLATLTLTLAAVTAGSQLSAQTIMQNPTACFGRDCNPVARIAANRVYENDCFRVENDSIVYDINRSGCDNNPLPGSASISVEFGNLQTSTNSHKFALYSFEEIQNTVAAFGPKIRMFLTYSGSYEACPSMGTWLNIGLAIRDTVVLSCGNSLKSFGFNVDRKANFFRGDFDAAFGDPNAGTYTDFDLSKCTGDMTLSYRTSDVCRLNVDLLQLVFEQK